MSAQSPIKAAPQSTPLITGWVEPCSNCDGEGMHGNGRGRGGNDPDSWDIPCEMCESEGYFPCEVCGNTVHLDTVDCFVCDSIGCLPSDGITKEQAEILHRCLGQELLRATTAPPVGEMV